MFKTISLILLVGILAWAYQVIQPPPSKLCASPGGPPVTATRIKLRDRRHVAYKEHGVPKDKANYQVVFVHGLQSCRHDFTFLPQEFAEEHGIFVVSFDRAGYGESDPNPNRTVKSTALDIEELVDQLGLGPKFYVMGYSMGGQVIWSCLKYIPHRLLGATLLTPAINYWWPGFPANLSTQVYNKLLVQDQWAYRVVYYTPWLAYWWNTQKLSPASALFADGTELLSPPDMALILEFAARQSDSVVPAYFTFVCEPLGTITQTRAFSLNYSADYLLLEDFYLFCCTWNWLAAHTFLLHLRFCYLIPPTRRRQDELSDDDNTRR